MGARMCARFGVPPDNHALFARHHFSVEICGDTLERNGIERTEPRKRTHDFLLNWGNLGAVKRAGNAGILTIPAPGVTLWKRSRHASESRNCGGRHSWSCYEPCGKRGRGEGAQRRCDEGNYRRADT